MNKKYGILFVFVLLVGAMFLSACQSEVRAKVNRNLAVNRNETVNYTLTTSVNPINSGSVYPTNGTYNLNTIISITATPKGNYTFSNWSGTITGISNLTNRIISVKMDRNRNLMANFRRR